jgi:hypothetical protein
VNAGGAPEAVLNIRIDPASVRILHHDVRRAYQVLIAVFGMGPGSGEMTELYWDAKRVCLKREEYARLLKTGIQVVVPIRHAGRPFKIVIYDVPGKKGGVKFLNP